MVPLDNLQLTSSSRSSLSKSLSAGGEIACGRGNFFIPYPVQWRTWLEKYSKEVWASRVSFKWLHNNCQLVVARSMSVVARQSFVLWRDAVEGLAAHLTDTMWLKIDEINSIFIGRVVGEEEEVEDEGNV